MKKNTFNIIGCIVGVAITLCLILYFSLAGFRTKKAEAVDEKIDSLPVFISLYDGDEIAEIQEMLNELNAMEVRSLKWKKAFDNKVKAYNELEEAEISEIEGKINAIPDVEEITLSAKDVIYDATVAYQSTTEIVKSKISNADYLELAIERLEPLMVAEIDRRIEELPSVKNLTLSDKKIVSEVQQEYKLASDSVKEQLKNTDKLEAAIFKIEELKEATWKNCSTCHGSGKEECINCGGAGVTRWYASLYDEGWIDDCPLCDGKGKYTCETCDGKGGRYED